MINPIKIVGQLLVIGSLFAGVAAISNRPVYRQDFAGYRHHDAGLRSRLRPPD